VATIGQIADIAQNVGGDHVQVIGLMGPGVDPHLYRESPSDIEKLSQADAIFYNGVHLEGRMADLFEKLAERRPTFAVTHALVAAKDPRLRKPPEFEGYYDPHVWHYPSLWADCVKYVTSVMFELDPSHREDYERNGAAYEKQLVELDDYCRQRLAEIPKPQRVLVTAHDAFGYFCITYDIQSMPLGGVTTEEEVSIGRMDEVVNFLVEHKVKAIFVESSVPHNTIERISKDAGVKIGGELFSDAMGTPGQIENGYDLGTYQGMIKHNLNTIVEGLK
jgi:manganese/zinc/iron transport system substrate-binding protein